MNTIFARGKIYDAVWRNVSTAVKVATPRIVYESAAEVLDFARFAVSDPVQYPVLKKLEEYDFR